MAMNGQASVFFPALDGAHVAVQECGDLLPGVEAIAGRRFLRRRRCRTSGFLVSCGA
jgi:hypothetical protein